MKLGRDTDKIRKEEAEIEETESDDDKTEEARKQAAQEKLWKSNPYKYQSENPKNLDIKNYDGSR